MTIIRKLKLDKVKFCTLLIFFLVGCGSEEEQFVNNLGPKCKTSDINYMHTALHCGEFIPENVTSIFIICNPLKDNDREGCCQEGTMRALEDNCFLTNVCIEPWEYE
jgi:hypothetical protein